MHFYSSGGLDDELCTLNSSTWLVGGRHDGDAHRRWAKRHYHSSWEAKDWHAPRVWQTWQRGAPKQVWQTPKIHEEPRPQSTPRQADGTHARGTIAVDCDRCRRQLVTGMFHYGGVIPAHQINMALKIAGEAGWLITPEKGSLCPNCKGD